MATYREIKGLKVPYLDSDLPSASASTEEGGVWYNSISGKLRAFVAADTWATSASIGTTRTLAGGAGIQTAALLISGFTDTSTANVEEYNGSGWAEIADVNTARYDCGSAGTSTSAIFAGGSAPPP